MSYQQIPRVWTTDYICELLMLFMSEISTQNSVITFACSALAQKSFLARAIFDEIHGVWSNFLHGLPMEPKPLARLVCARPFLPRIAGKGR